MAPARRLHSQELEATAKYYSAVAPAARLKSRLLPPYSIYQTPFILMNPSDFDTPSTEAVEVTEVIPADEFESNDSDSCRFPDDFPFVEPFKPEPYQLKAFHKFYSRDYGAIFFEQGLGKTFTSINLVSAWAMRGDITGALIICPGGLIDKVWKKELRKFCPIPNVIERVKDLDDNRKITDFEWGLISINVLERQKAFDPNGWGLHAERFLNSHGGKCAIVIDESTTIKNPDPTKFRFSHCMRLAEKSVKRLILTGTPCPEGLHDTWTQYAFLSMDILKISTIEEFKAKFCVIEKIAYKDASGKMQEHQRIVGIKNKATYFNAVNKHTLMITKEHGIPDLPNRKTTVVYVDLSDDERKAHALAYKSEALIDCEIDGGMVVDAPDYMNKSYGMRYATSGLLYAKDEVKEKKVWRMSKMSTKMKALREIISNTDDKIMVVFCFKEDFESAPAQLRDLEHSLNRKIYSLTGNPKCKEGEEFEAHDGACILVASKAASHGFTFISCNKMVFYGVEYSMETHLQIKDRIHRRGQTRECEYIYLMARDSIDEQILDRIGDKQDLYFYTRGHYSSDVLTPMMPEGEPEWVTPEEEKRRNKSKKKKPTTRRDRHHTIACIEARAMFNNSHMRQNMMHILPNPSATSVTMQIEFCRAKMWFYGYEYAEVAKGLWMWRYNEGSVLPECCLVCADGDIPAEYDFKGTYEEGIEAYTTIDPETDKEEYHKEVLPVIHGHHPADIQFVRRFAAKGWQDIRHEELVAYIKNMPPFREYEGLGLLKCMGAWLNRRGWWILEREDGSVWWINPKKKDPLMNEI